MKNFQCSISFQIVNCIKTAHFYENIALHRRIIDNAIFYGEVEFNHTNFQMDGKFYQIYFSRRTLFLMMLLLIMKCISKVPILKK